MWPDGQPKNPLDQVVWIVASLAGHWQRERHGVGNTFIEGEDLQRWHAVHTAPVSDAGREKTTKNDCNKGRKV